MPGNRISFYLSFSSAEFTGLDHRSQLPDLLLPLLKTYGAKHGGEMEAGESEVQGHPELLSKFELAWATGELVLK